MKMRIPFLHFGPAFSLRRTLLPALALAAGMAGGMLWALRLGDESLAQLSAYLERYSAAVNGELSASAVWGTVWAYFRCPVWLAFFAFCGAGAFFIPAVLAAEGFGLGLAVMSFSAAMGRQGALLALAVLGLRCVFVFPCTLCMGCFLWRPTGDKKRTSGPPPRSGTLGVCMFLLAVGAVLEITLVPRFLALIL